MPKRYFRDSSNKLVSVTQSDNLATPTGHTVITEAIIRAVYPESSGPIYVQGIFDGSTYTPPGNQPNALTSKLLEFHGIYRTYQTICRQDIWKGIKDSTGGDRYSLASIKLINEPLDATDRWAYSQIALADRIIRDEWPSTALTGASKIEALEQLFKWISTPSLVYTWYGVVSGSNKNTARGNWARNSIAGNSSIYSDLLTTTGAVRTADATWPAVGATFHTNFDPEFTSLRSV